jgi:hypothetical protein
LKNIIKKSKAKRKFRKIVVSNQLGKQTMSTEKLNKVVQKKVNAAYDSLSKQHRLEPNPFLFTRIERRIEEIENSASAVSFIPAKQVLQPVLMSLIILLALLGGIRIGSIWNTTEQTNEKYTTEYLLNDIKQEHIEVALLK